MLPIPEEALSQLAKEYKVSDLELEALLLALHGMRADQIAVQLGITSVAIRKRLGVVYEKFGIAGNRHGKLILLKDKLLTLYQQQQQESKQLRVDWGDAVDVSNFYGRTEELTELKRWVVSDRCRLIALVGVGGIGKTSLAVKLAKTEAVQQAFESIAWRSLKNAPPLNELLASLMQFLGADSETGTNLPDTLSAQIDQFLAYLRDRRCLLVLDNVESLFQKGQAGIYQDGCSGYDDFFKRIGESVHQSCLILTSREKPKEVAVLEGETLPVRSYQLAGLERKDAAEILRAKGIGGSDREFQQLMDLYNRNPLALKIVATTVKELFRGSIATFLEQTVTTFVGDIRSLLAQQLDRLCDSEKDVVYWLAINRQPTAIPDLQRDILSPLARLRLVEDLESLHRRSLIEVDERAGSARFSLQPAIAEYVTYRFIEQIYAEIQSGKIALFNSHVLVKAESDIELDVKEAQTRLILEPIAQQLAIALGSKDAIKNALLRLVPDLQAQSPLVGGYAAANILHLLRHLQISVEGCDFSNLHICQADFEGMTLHRVNLSHSTLTRCSFTDILDSILCVTLSPDGKWLAAGDCDGTIHLWQATNGKKFRTWRAHGNWVRFLTFSPDSQSLASCSDDQSLQLWDVNTGEAIYHQAIEGHRGWVWSIAFSPDGKTLASASSDRTIRLWRVEDGKPLQVFDEHQDFVRSVAFSPDGTILASGSADGTVRLWNLRTQQCTHVLKHYQPDRPNRIWTVAFSPDGKVLASGGDDAIVRLWDVQQGDCLAALKGHADVIRAIAFSSTGYLASCGDDTTVRLWDWQKRQCVQTLEGHDSRIWSVAFGSDGQILASGGDDKTVRLWSTSSWRCIRVLQGYTNTIWALAYAPSASLANSPDSQTLVSASDDKVIRLWNLQTGEYQTLGEHEGRVWSVAFSPDGTKLATGGDDRIVRLWHLQTGKSQILKRCDAWVRAVAFSPDGTTLAIGGDDKQIQQWNIEQEQWLPPLEGHINTVRSIVYAPRVGSVNHPDGQILVSGSDDETVRIWNLESGEVTQIQQPPGRSKNRVWAIAFHPSGNLFAYGGDDSTVKLWNLQTQQQEKIFVLETSGYTRSVAFSPDGRWLASGGTNNVIYIWDVATGHCLKQLQGHTNWVRAVVFSPDGQTLASASQDWTIRLWDVETGKCRQVLYTPRIYEGAIFTHTQGLSSAQRQTLKLLGAIE